MSQLLETLQPHLDILATDGNASIKTFADSLTTVVSAYDSDSLTKLPEFPEITNADILKAVFSKIMIDAQTSVEASGETIIDATTEIHSTISALS